MPGQVRAGVASKGVDRAGSEARSWSTVAGSKVDEGGNAPDWEEKGSVGGDGPVEFAAGGFGIQREPGRRGVLGVALKVGGIGLVEGFVSANWWGSVTGYWGNSGDRSPAAGDRSPATGDRSPATGDRSPRFWQSLFVLKRWGQNSLKII
ncbi:hypothetical protein ACLB2K_021659 [Fragaria x ananassa]